MPWHRSISNLSKVYNERHEQVCVCETPEQAALIVDAVRSFATNKPDLFGGESYVPKPNTPAGTEERGYQSKRGRVGSKRFLNDNFEMPEIDDDGFAIIL